MLVWLPRIVLAQGELRVQPKPPNVPRTVAVLILSGAKSGFPLSEIYAAARRPLERYTALRVAPLETIGLDERDAAIRDCAGDPACFARRVRASQNDVDLLLAVSVDRSEDALLVGLRLIDTFRRAEVGAGADEVPAGMSLEGALEDRLATVVPPSVWGDVGSLSIRSEPEGAEVWVGERTCITPCELGRLLPGSYDIVLRKSGWEPWQKTVAVGRGDNIVQADLPRPSRALVESPWLWTAVGAVIVAGTVTSVLLLQQPERRAVVCFSSMEDFCPSGD